MSPESKEYQGRLTTVYQVATSFNAVATWAQTKQVEPVWPDDVTLTADQVESFQTRFTVSRAVREEAQAWMAGDSDGHDLFILFPNADAAQMETVAQFLLQTDQPSTHVQRWIWPYLAPEETTSRQAALRSAEGMESLLTTWRSQYDTDPRT